MSLLSGLLLAGQQSCPVEGPLRAAAQGYVRDPYLTALPFLPGPQTPVRELNSGDVYHSSPVFGFIRVYTQEGEGGTCVCIGDSVDYELDGDARQGRVVGLMVSEEAGGVSARTRRYMSSKEVVDLMPDWAGGDAGVEDGLEEGLWETCWDDVIHVSSIISVLKLRLTGGQHAGDGGSVLLAGTVDDNGEWATPYSRPLVPWEQPWLAMGGVRSETVRKLCAAADTGCPIANVCISFWSDGFQTYTRGQVRCEPNNLRRVSYM